MNNDKSSFRPLSNGRADVNREALAYRFSLLWKRGKTSKGGAAAVALDFVVVRELFCNNINVISSQPLRYHRSARSLMTSPTLVDYRSLQKSVPPRYLYPGNLGFSEKMEL